MSRIDKIVADLDAVLAGLDRARAHIGGALEHARGVKASMVAAGFGGIAMGMVQVEEHLEAVVKQLGGLTGQARAAVTTVRSIDDEMNPEQVVGLLFASAESIGVARTLLGDTMQAMATASQHIAAVLRGGKPGPLLSMIAAAQQTLIQVGQHLDPATEKINGAMGEARQAGN